jgi:hypothetical protein
MPGLAESPALLLSLRKEKDTWILGFSPDETQREGQALGYRKGHWSELRLDFCENGKLAVDCGGEVKGEFTVSDNEMPLRIEAKSLEISLRAL